MLYKKYPRFNLNLKRPVFFHLGSVLALSFIILAFEWETEPTYKKLDISGQEVEIEEMLEIPITSVATPPPPPTSIPDEIVESKKEISQLAEIVELSAPVELVETPVSYSSVGGAPLMEPVEEEVFDNITILSGGQMASPQGGMEAFYTYLKKTIRMPEIARRAGVSGKVYVHFMVEKDGQISQVRVIKGIGFGCDEAAKEAIEKAPTWNPAMHNGRKVKYSLVVPVYFSMQ